jgi:hypothetical protein
MAYARPTMDLATWIVHASLLVSDSRGRHPERPIAAEGAAAIAHVCEGKPTEYEARKCAAIYVVMAFHESGFRLDAVGDGGLARGPFQVHTSHAPRTWTEAVKQYTPLLTYSMKTCAEPLEVIVVGHCGTAAGQRISRERMAEAERLASSQALVSK